MSELDAASLAAEEGEYLDPGYDAQTPDGDNLLLDFCRAEVQLWTSWGAALDAAHGIEEDGTVWVDARSPSVFGNPVLWTRPLDGPAAEAAVARQAKAFGQRPGGAYLLYSAYPTPDLSGRGLRPVGHPPCMVRVPENSASQLATPADLDVRRVDSTAQLADFERTLIEAYPIPDLMPWRPGVFMGERLLSDPRWHIFVGYTEREAVATAAAYVSDHAVDVTLVTCRTEARGRGFGRAVTQAAVDADPAKPAMLLASDDGQPVYRSMGFRTMNRFTLWVGPRPSS
jgi:ribosomal protein S18 acetylase RimI-like enzyme